ncbi:serine hydrolase domain-containing protein [Jannaschia seohaensis]|uniref:CubicO group peptidase (Beta-lactamase class C family) n=1 Tax=Jannaschia seohaensis TaxID=475081 RepID=A0A2Y9AYA6_9RHOB|nr:serine hydrolase [Jannaschia seohaensis]PWJ16213.1 CubicO group peptidase (beta-lactamase class C family) [Jannaschia seohaensis]SSA49250.1 CubicO group peptidase, beta-lactamase class C family [Jannaschia seohaensis]
MRQLTRRTALFTGAAALAAPAALRASAALDAVAAEAAALDQLHSFQLVQGGAPLLSLAPRGPGLERIANVKSVSKTLLSLLTGIAVDRGHLSGPEVRVLPLLGRAPAGDARDALTVGHLLSMRTGLPSTSGPRYGAWVESRDWVSYVLDAEPEGRPGTGFTYSTGTWHVLGAVLARVTGRDLHALASDWLADPLDIALPRWDRDPQGFYLGGNQMAMTPRALARVGEMVRQGGRWQGRQVVPEAWIDASWEPRARSPWSGDSYGYGWFLTQLDGVRAAYGRGYGGQVLAVVPARGLTLAVTSDPNRPARSRGYFGDLKRLMAAAAEAAA